MLFNKNKKEITGAPESGEAAHASISSKLLGSRALMPLVLAAGIGTQVQSALAEVPSHTQASTVSSYAEGTDFGYNKATSGPEISRYFAEHKEEILKKISASHDDKKTLKDIEQAVTLVAHNNRTHAVIITSGELAHNAFAQYGGLSRTITIPTNFDVQNLAHQSHLIHEVVHALQDDRIRKNAQRDPSLVERRDAFWSSHGETIAVAEHEQAAIEAAIVYVDAMTGGALKKTVNDYANFEQYKTMAKKALLKNGVHPSESVDSIVHRAYFYFGLKQEWPYFIQHLYGCKEGATLYSESFFKKGKLSNAQCDELKESGGM